jgi:tetratricopeptide (TPR) repeat protein
MLAPNPVLALSAETNSFPNTASRPRDDKSAALTLAVQAVQQLQTQQRATLQAVEEARQQTEAASQRYEQRVESLRHLLFGLGASVGIVMLGAALYIGWWLRRLRDRGPWPMALKWPLTANARMPDDVARATALLVRGQALLEQRHPVDALTCFEQAIALDGRAANAFVKKGAALEGLGRLDEALATYEQALALDASRADAYIGKGNVLNRLERFEEALACFEQAADHHHAHGLMQAPRAANEIRDYNMSAQD